MTVARAFARVEVSRRSRRASGGGRTPIPPQAADARRRLVQEAERALNAARSDTGNIESARAALERVETERLALPAAAESASGAAQ